MTANSQQVMHDPLRRTKHVSVDSLHHKGFAFSLMGLRQESVIDVAIAKRANTTDIATGYKLAGNAAQFWLPGWDMALNGAWRRGSQVATSETT